MGKMRRKRLSLTARQVWLACLVLGMSLSACVPIPIARRGYVPNKADTAIARGEGDGCSFNATSQKGLHRVGNVEVSSYLYTQDFEGVSPRATLRVGVTERFEGTRFERAAVNASGITLQEGGRVLRGRLKDTKTHTWGSGAEKANYTSFEVAFPSPSGLGENVRIVFSPNAVRLGGRTIPLKPIRFELDEKPLIYMFPCIPT
ncbi:hypothetical protein [Pseudophaeobacter sp.]|uniref:hypothetical protein n=1 Tax=Pseudophaeobacter sp. TaxID=1971739 RepID=UPI003298A811